MQRKALRDVLITIGCVVGGLVALVVLVLCCLTWYLTDERAADYLDKYASEYFQADFRAGKVRYTIWSTFPKFCLEIDSMQVRSRALDGLPRGVREKLPEGSDFLVGFRRLKGEVNVMKALRGSWELGDLEVEGLKVNLVTATDSVSNYDIYPESSQGTSLDYLTFRSLSLKDRAEVSYFSLPTAVSASVKLDKADIRRLSEEENSYSLALQGLVSSDVERIPVISDLPASLGGSFRMLFQPFKIKCTGFRASAAGINTDVACSIDIGDDLTINSLDANINSLDLISLWRYVSGRWFPGIDNLVGKIQLESNIRLVHPYSTQKSGRPVLDMEISKIAVDGPLTHLTASARIEDILGSPSVAAHVEGPLDLSLMNRFIGPSQSYEGRGRANLDLLIDNKALKNMNFLDIGLRGVLAFTQGAYALDGGKLTLTAPSGEIRFDFSPEATTTAFSGPSAEVSFGGVRFSMADVRGSSDKIHSGEHGLTFNLSGSDARLREKGSAENVSADHLGMSLGIRYDKGNRLRLAVQADTLRYKSTSTSLSFAGVQMDFAANPFDYVPAGARLTRGDTAILHSPENIIVRAPGKVTDLLDKWDGSLRFRARKGLLLNKAFPAYNHVDNLDVTLASDRVELRSLDLRAQRSALSMNGTIEGLRGFLNDMRNAPLRARLNLDIDTLSFNQIAHTYNVGADLTGHPVVLRDKPEPLSAFDTTAWMVPRNIDLLINAKAKACVYTNLDLYNLSMKVRAKDGCLGIDSLRIYASFGNALISAHYDTSDIQRMHLDASMDLNQVNVVKFFEKYHTLLEMMPEMKNLSGYVDFSVNGAAYLFPDMFVNIPSLTAELTAEGRGLKVHQNHFIRHVTKLMLIPTDGDLHIANINARANVHDCLLELYPVDIAFDRYNIRMMGANDFGGDLNYHIDILKSPIPLPFGIHIAGLYHKPDIRLSSRHYNVRDTQLDLNVAQWDSLNAIQEARYYLRRFVHNASVSDNTSDTRYAFPTH